MMFLRLLPVFFTALFILTRTINVKVLKNDKWTVKINFNILAIILTPDGVKKRGIIKDVKLLRKVRGAFASIDYLLSKSDAKLFLTGYSNSDRENTSVRSIYLVASNTFILPYIESRARSFSVIKRLTRDSNSFQLILRFSLWHLIISSFILLYYITNDKIKRIIKNV